MVAGKNVCSRLTDFKELRIYRKITIPSPKYGMFNNPSPKYYMFNNPLPKSTHIYDVQ